ncbi:hypothetical protein PtA15_3A35 [Puccinia triticina]|uniref:Uncharacterized protein n=1 Tax=Puccinia triticina TaxID=208348 RepID=A0ABY7CDY5_9BASI|nr:uncharacterized protein PtA15_3A35 [Puccinia triticina]WAQ82672.1 hypothetical protein PtA15_3A35 [Puccinia triticina]WAR53520.1 hypothetical protein PtB15_3B28 [Puccinia triticina]
MFLPQRTGMDVRLVISDQFINLSPVGKAPCWQTKYSRVQNCLSNWDSGVAAKLEKLVRMIKNRLRIEQKVFEGRKQTKQSREPLIPSSTSQPAQAALGTVTGFLGTAPGPFATETDLSSSAS